MRLAVLSDIHGNLTALDAVLEDAKMNKAQGYIIAGDHTCDGPQPKEVLERIRGLKAWIICGNREQYLLKYHNGEAEDWDEHEQMAAVVWTYDQLDKSDLGYIGSLPEQLTVDIPGTAPIRVVHGSPFDVYEHLYPDKYAERLEKALGAVSEPVLVCGHTHQPWYKRVQERLVVNPGALGVHFNEESAAEYALMTWEKNRWNVEHRRVKYDISKLERQFERSGMAADCSIWTKATLVSLKSGRNVMVDFVRFAYKVAEESGLKGCKLVPDEMWHKADQLWNWEM